MRRRPEQTPAALGEGRDDSPDVRLDRIQSPFDRSPMGTDTVEAWCGLSDHVVVQSLRQRLSSVYRVPADAIWLLPGADQVIRHVVQRSCGPVLGFPPSTVATTIAGAAPAWPLWIQRGPGKDSGIDVELAADIPATSIAIVDSPSDPLGSVVSTADAVRLSRSCQALLIDERFGEYGGGSKIPLSAEFDNIAVMRSFEPWAGVQSPPFAWAVASPRTAAFFSLAELKPQREALAAAISTVANLDVLELTLRLTREERSRLYRFLRKLSILEPIPSWGPFVSARVHIVPRERLVRGLAQRGVHVHSPIEQGLERFIRIGIGSRSAMERLRLALLDLAAELVT